VDEWRPGSDGPAATRKGTDRLEAEDILPGFSFPIANYSPE